MLCVYKPLSTLGGNLKDYGLGVGVRLGLGLGLSLSFSGYIYIYIYILFFFSIQPNSVHPIWQYC